MAVHAIPGILVLDPTDATTGGTNIVGIDDDGIEFDDGREFRVVGSGFQRDAFDILPTRGRAPVLRLPLRDQGSTSMQLLFDYLSIGTAIHSDGGQASPNYVSTAVGALLIRPVDTTQLYFYGPRWVLHPENEGRIVWHRNRLHFDGSVLALTPRRSINGTLRAWSRDTAANINSYYGLGES